MSVGHVAAAGLAIVGVGWLVCTHAGLNAWCLRRPCVRRSIFYVKGVAAALLTGLMSCVGCGIAAVCAVLGDRANINHYVGRVFAAAVAPLLGITFRIEGAEHLDQTTTPCVFISNHQSNLDILTMGRVFPRRTVVLAKRALLFYPVLGLYMWLAKNFFVNRANHSSAVETMARAADYMRRERMSMYIYPEGTRSHQTNNQLLPFKKGAFHLAIQAQAPIVCLVFSTYAPEYRPLEDLPAASPELSPLAAAPPPPESGALAETEAKRRPAAAHRRSVSSDSVQKYFQTLQQQPLAAEPGRIIYSSKLRCFDGGEIRIRVLPPISTAGLTSRDVDTVIERVRNLMLHTLRDISGHSVVE